MLMTLAENARGLVTCKGTGFLSHPPPDVHMCGGTLIPLLINVGSRGGWQRAVCEPACSRKPSATSRRAIAVAECDFIYSLMVVSIFGCIHGLLAHCRAG